LVSMTGIVDCTIEPVEDSVLGEAIKAILVVNKEKDGLTPESIREYCSKRLALYKIPAFIEFKDHVEVNAAGKKVKKH